MPGNYVKRPQTELARSQGNCKWCNVELKGRLKYAPRFCSDEHRELWESNQDLSRGYKGRKDTAAIRGAKSLAFDNLYDPIRDTIREEVRATISQRVKDNVLGMTELMSDLLPMVLAGLAVDLQSEDVFIRQKAQALILKYVMPLKNEEPTADDTKVLNVIHRVAVPDTLLGEAVEAELAALPPGIEPFEQDWPVCWDCGERKNPSTGKWRDHNGVKDERWWCHACSYRAQIRAGRADPTTDHNTQVGEDTMVE